MAGNGTQGYNGDNIAAISAQLNYPRAVTVDRDGNIYIADANNKRIRRVDAVTGIINTVAGNGSCAITISFGYCYSGDGGLAINAELSFPISIAVDGSGNLYIADLQSERVRMVNAATGVITTIAGNGYIDPTTAEGGYNGDGIPAVSAELWYPEGVALDAAGNVYIADVGNNRLRMVTAAIGIISTVAGKGIGSVVFDGDLAHFSAEIQPVSVAVDGSGNLYFADLTNQRIRKLNVSDAPSLAVPDTNVGSVSASQDIQIENLGNSPLNIAQIGTAANFTLGGTNTSCAANGQLLDPAANCTLGIQFAPQTAGTIVGSVTLVDNTLNLNGATQQLQLSVTAVTVNLASIAVTPSSTTLSSGSTQQFSATGMYSDGSTQDLTGSATWRSSSPAVATVSGGLASALAAGSTTISANWSSITSNSVTLTVQAQKAVAPTLSPAPGVFNAAQPVTLTTSSPGAAIYYTMNGSMPTVSTGTLYTGPISVTSSTTVKAIAAGGDFASSSITSGNYNIVAVAPTLSPAPGTYTVGQSVTLNTPSGVSIYYTTNGTTPTISSGSLYTGPITISSSTVIKAIAVVGGVPPLTPRARGRESVLAFLWCHMIERSSDSCL